MDYYYFSNLPTILPTKTVTIEHYPNEGQAVRVDGHYEYIKYANGDRIWLKLINGEYVVTMVCTYDEHISTGFNRNPFGKPSEHNYRFEDDHGNVIIWSSETLPDSELNKNYTLKAVI